MTLLRRCLEVLEKARGGPRGTSTKIKLNIDIGLRNFAFTEKTVPGKVMKKT